MMEKTTPRLAVVTGFSSGIGFEVTRGLLEAGWRVIGVARNADRARRATEILRAQTGNAGLNFCVADLSLMTDALAVGETIKGYSPRLDLLINNAGAIYKQREETAEGVERTVALNHVGMFALTIALVPVLQGRIVNVASAAHHGARLDFDDLGMAHRYHGWKQYSRSKLMNILFTRELARRLPDGVSATCVHPGFVNTSFGRENGLLWRLTIKALMKIKGLTPRDSARGVLRVALDPDLAGANGQYFDRGHPTRPSPAAEDDAAALTLWEETEKLVSPLLERLPVSEPDAPGVSASPAADPPPDHAPKDVRAA